MRLDRKHRSFFWSDGFVMPKDEQSALDLWFYENLLSNDQSELKLNFFNSQMTLFEREFRGNSIIEFLLYAQGKSFNFSPKELDNKLRERIIALNYSEEVYWFTCYQSHTYKHDLGSFGIYSFKRQSENPEMNGELLPVFDNLINPEIGQGIKHNYKLCSGLIDKNKKWLLILSIDNGDKKKISMEIAGDTDFCKLFKE